MDYVQHNVWQQLKLGEELIADGIDVVVRRWQASASALGKLCASDERWQALLRQIQAPVNLAEILRNRTFI
ncbi:MAG: hypothetical protein QOF32_175 [Gammaproteobacteria bacterium]|jgi:hypothetical protein|nr:hypothetical protein [Gammaproteobacteria bacterium]